MITFPTLHTSMLAVQRCSRFLGFGRHNTGMCAGSVLVLHAIDLLTEMLWFTEVKQTRVHHLQDHKFFRVAAVPTDQI